MELITLIGHDHDVTCLNICICETLQQKLTICLTVYLLKYTTNTILPLYQFS